jgi:hypothetical protein
MILQVVNDLRAFFTFYMYFIFIGALVFDLIGGNPGTEYRLVGPFFTNILFTMRISLGDFNFDLLNDQLATTKPWQQTLFWVTWYAYVIFGLLIFLNFIIAEVGNSYVTVRSKMSMLI